MGKILVADDERGILDVLERVFQRRGHEVETFADGASAVEALEAEGAAYDLVITDLRMPGKGGLEVLAAAKTRRPAMPVIIVSGSAEVEDREKADALGVYTMLHKPVDLAYLLTIAESAMQDEGKTLVTPGKKLEKKASVVKPATSAANPNPLVVPIPSAGSEPVVDGVVRVVESDACLANLVAWCLRKQGYKVAIGVGKCAMAVVGDGEAIEALRKEAPKAVIFALHAAGDADDAVAVLDAGADVALPRPFEPEVLFAHIRAGARRAAEPKCEKSDDKPITRNRLAAVKN